MLLPREYANCLTLISCISNRRIAAGAPTLQYQYLRLNVSMQAITNGYNKWRCGHSDLDRNKNLLDAAL